MQAEKSVREKSAQSPGETAILSAGVRLFSEQGYDGVSMRGVAQEAGVSKANIYHHFSSKEALYLAILQSSAEETGELVESLAEGTGSFEERLSKFSKAYQQHLFERKLTSRLLLREVLSGDEIKGKKIADQVVGNVFRGMISILCAGQEAGVIRDELDPALCAFLLMGSNVFFFQAHGVLKHFPEAKFAQEGNSFSDGMVDVFLNGMLNQKSNATNKDMEQ